MGNVRREGYHTRKRVEVRTNRGFLLFEVVVSIVIITAGILFIMRSYSSSKDSIARSGEILRTSLLLEDKMWEYEAMEEVGSDKDSGDFEDAEGYAWEMEAEPPEVEGFDMDPKYNVIRLSVFKEREKEKTEYTIWTYLKYKFI